jgi:Lipocalin-like domain
MDAFGKNAKGLIVYGKERHFLALITNDDRPKPESIGTMTDQQRSDLFRTMTAYGGTYTFDGKKVEHHIDLSWNEVWTGTTVIRDVKVEGDRIDLHESAGPVRSRWQDECRHFGVGKGKVAAL